MKRNDDDICPHYRDPIEAQFSAGQISKRKRGSLLNNFWITYLPNKPPACILRNPGMWATDKHQVVCVGCGQRARDLGITTLEGWDEDKLHPVPLSELEDQIRELKT